MAKTTKGKTTTSLAPAPTEEYVCTRPGHFGNRCYYPGERLEVQKGTEVPEYFESCRPRKKTSTA